MDDVEAASQEGGDVFHEHAAGSKTANGVGHASPEAGTGAVDAFEATAQEIADALPDPTLVILPDTDHFPFLEPQNRAAWSQAVLDFLTR